MDNVSQSPDRLDVINIVRNSWNGKKIKNPPSFRTCSGIFPKAKKYVGWARHCGGWACRNPRIEVLEITFLTKAVPFLTAPGICRIFKKRKCPIQSDVSHFRTKSRPSGSRHGRLYFLLFTIFVLSFRLKRQRNGEI